MHQQACDGELQEAEAAKEVAEQRFWLPLERSKGRQMGELCVSLLFTKVCTCAGPDFLPAGQSTEHQPPRAKINKCKHWQAHVPAT